MISQEAQPGLGLVSSFRWLDHVLPDGVWTGGIETQQDQMSIDRFRTPPPGLVEAVADDTSSSSLSRQGALPVWAAETLHGSGNLSTVELMTSN